MSLRSDMQIISEWVQPDSSVLDLGCGDGSLLHQLQTTRQVRGYGLEIEPAHIVECLNSDVNVIQMDLNEGLSEFDDDSFDYVIMTQTLQAISHPEKLLEEMLRVGREGIVTFPNFGHWRSRLQLLMGHMPTTPALPELWYSTKNIHLCTLVDFEKLCHDMDIRILQRTVVDHRHRSSLGIRLWPNLLGEIAMYRFKHR
jgi:methionine biosynthesis protein MetW